MTQLTRLLVLSVWFAVGCASVKPPLQAVDGALVIACEGMAQAVARKSGADATRIVEKTCAVEGFTRTMRELLLSAQIEAARAEGVLMPSINTGALEDEAPAVPAE
jgi:hypothetical protein